MVFRELLFSLGARHLHYARAALEHLMTVEEDDDGCSNGKQVAIPGLGIGENRVYDVQVIQDGDGQADC